MNDVYNSDYYVRLKIGPTASQETIKAAFFSMVREYTPQRFPDEYKLIREAYDILKNPITRDDYDSRLRFGPEIESLNHQLDQAMDGKSWSKAEAVLKKLINFQPKSSLLRKRLGQVYRKLEKNSLALEAFKKAIELNPDDSSHLVDLAHVYRDMKSFSEAEHYYKQAVLLDETNTEAIRELAFMYWVYADRKMDAVKELEKAIDSDGVLDFQDFFYIFDLLRMHLLGNEIIQMQKRLNQLSAIINQDDDRNMVINSILGLIDLGVELQYFNECAVLYSYLSKLDDDKEWPKNAMLLSQTQEFYDRKDCNELIRIVTLLLTMYYFGSISDADQKNLDELQGLLPSQVDTSSSNAEIKHAIKVMKSEFHYLYDLNSKKWDTIMNWGPSKFGSKCPHCEGSVNTPLNEFGQYNCPHCREVIVYNSGGFAKLAAEGCLVSTLFIAIALLSLAIVGCGILF